MNFAGSNFQAWPDFDFEISGLTVIVGRSNIGKSALFRALRGILRNEMSAAYVRNGQKKPLELTLKVGNDTVKATRARDGSAEYILNGKQRFSKLNQQVPDEVKKLGFNDIKVGDFPALDPIFAIQNEPQFLLDKKTYGPGLLNAVLGAFGGTEKLEAGKKEANLRVQQKNSEAKTLSFEIAEAHQRKDVLEKITKVTGQLVKEIHSLESSVRVLEARAGWMGLTHTHRTRLVPIREILTAFQLPDTSGVVVLQDQLVALNGAREARRRGRAVKRVVQSIDLTSAGWTEIVTLYRKIKSLNEVQPLIEARDASTATEDARQLNNIVGRVEDLSSEANRLEASIRVLGQTVSLRGRVAELLHERSHIEAEQNTANLVKCPQCGAEF